MVEKDTIKYNKAGDQIGGAVERLLWGYEDWRDEIQKFHEQLIVTTGGLFLKRFGEENHIREVRFSSLGREYNVGYPDGEERTGVVLDWNKQVAWAEDKYNSTPDLYIYLNEVIATLTMNRRIQRTENLIKRFER